jgi:hypothetical protein
MGNKRSRPAKPTLDDHPFEMLLLTDTKRYLGSKQKLKVSRRARPLSPSTVSKMRGQWVFDTIQVSPTNPLYYSLAASLTYEVSQDCEPEDVGFTWRVLNSQGLRGKVIVNPDPSMPIEISILVTDYLGELEPWDVICRGPRQDSQTYPEKQFREKLQSEFVTRWKKTYRLRHLNSTTGLYEDVTEQVMCSEIETFSYNSCFNSVLCVPLCELSPVFTYSNEKIGHHKYVNLRRNHLVVDPLRYYENTEDSFKFSYLICGAKACSCKNENKIQETRLRL